MDGSVLEEKSSKVLGLSLIGDLIGELGWIRALTLFLLLKLPLSKFRS